jgi:glutamate-1-semialdehyde 2,1-aminomutase
VYLGDIVKHPEHIRMLSFVGGETLLSRAAKAIVRHLVDEGHAKNMALAISTNGTTLSDEWLDLFGAFKRADISVSLEGMGPLNDYIRYPSKFSTILENIARMQKLPQTHLRLAIVVQAYNAMDLVPLLEHFEPLVISVYIGIANWPTQLSPRVLPPRARAIATERLRAYQRRRPGGPHPMIDSAIGVIEADGDQWDIELARTFMEFTNDLDASRHETLADVAPELVASFVEAGLLWDTSLRHAKPLLPSA